MTGPRPVGQNYGSEDDKELCCPCGCKVGGCMEARTQIPAAGSGSNDQTKKCNKAHACTTSNSQGPAEAKFAQIDPRNSAALKGTPSGRASAGRPIFNCNTGCKATKAPPLDMRTPRRRKGSTSASDGALEHRQRTAAWRQDILPGNWKLEIVSKSVRSRLSTGRKQQRHWLLPPR